MIQVLKKPFEVSYLTLASLKTIFQIKLQLFQLSKQNPTTKDGIPPICCEVMIAIGAVIDFVVIDKIMSKSTPKSTIAQLQ